ncbi:MAG TPA: N-formylglutamate amidohydrolase [Kiritimatiellia bacterium]|nr:N-formylglutamate amidohydrolase [Kiritimatiellia bacterium]
MPQKTAFYFSCEHAGNNVPRAYRNLFAGKTKLLSTHRGIDIGIWPVAKAVSKQLAYPVTAHHTTRLLVEVNRSPRHPLLFSEVTKALPRNIKEAILRDYYYPHRVNVENDIASAIAKNTRIIHIGFHSFTPALNGQKRLVDIGLLYDPRRPGEKMFCRKLRSILQTKHVNLRIRMNQPYRGVADGLTTYLRKRWSDIHYAGIEIEVNQRLLATAKSRTDLANLLTKTLKRMVKEIK